MSDKKFKVTKKEDIHEVISVRLKKSLVEMVDSISAETNRSRNEVINMCIEFAVNNFENEENE